LRAEPDYQLDIYHHFVSTAIGIYSSFQHFVMAAVSPIYFPFHSWPYSDYVGGLLVVFLGHFNEILTSSYNRPRSSFILS